jgi:hypothetical protein
MRPLKLVALCTALLAPVLPALIDSQDGPDQKPSVFLENDRYKPGKESNLRTVDGTVKDDSDNLLSGAIVQLKDLKTSKIVEFATKDDGKYVFHDLPMDVDFELLAKRGALSAPVKKLSIYDTRKHVIVNFQLAAAKQ